MNLNPYSLLTRASQYRWVFLLTMFLSVIAVLPIAQRAERQSQGLQPRPPGASTPTTKKRSLNSVPGEILVRFRPESKAKRVGSQVMIEKAGRQIAMSIKAINPTFEIVEGLRLAKVNPSDTSNALEALRARADVIYAEPTFVRDRKS